MIHRLIGWIVSAGLLFVAPAFAQQPAHAPAATMPSPGIWTLRTQARFHELENGNKDIEHGTFETGFSRGVVRDVSAGIQIPYRWQDEENQNSRDGLGDLTATVKWRLYKQDTSPIDTFRLAVIAGLEMPTGESAFSSDSFDPSIGLALTAIRGRHGVGGAVWWKFNTGDLADPIVGGDSDADAVWIDGSYLYRLVPAAYGLNSKASWYAVLETNALLESNGDSEVRISPGILYEAVSWAVECQVAWTLAEDIDHRPRHRFGTTLGIRWLF